MRKTRDWGQACKSAIHTLHIGAAKVGGKGGGDAFKCTPENIQQELKELGRDILGESNTSDAAGGRLETALKNVWNAFGTLAVDQRRSSAEGIELRGEFEDIMDEIFRTSDPPSDLADQSTGLARRMGNWVRSLFAVDPELVSSLAESSRSGQALVNTIETRIKNLSKCKLNKDQKANFKSLKDTWEFYRKTAVPLLTAFNPRQIASG